MTLAQMGIPVIEPTRTKLSPSEAVEQFKAFLASRGYEVPMNIVADGRIQRFSTGQKTKRDDAGWYVLYLDRYCYGVVGDWRSGDSTSWYPDVKIKDDPDFQAYRALNAKRRDEEIRQENELVARQVQELWAKLPYASPDHPYLVRKKVPNSPVIRQKDRDLVIPIMDEDGTLVSLEYIHEDGTKSFVYKGRTKGCWCYIPKESPLEPGDKLYLCEGYATAMSVHQATGAGVFVGFYCTNLAPCVKSIRKHLPDNEIIVIADNDENGAGLKGAEATGCRYLLIPEKGMDANDYATEFGVDALRGFLETDSEPMIGIPDRSLLDKEIEWLIEGVFGRTGVYELFCYRGTGKSFMAIRIAMSVLFGVPFGGHETRIANGLVYYLVGMNEGQGIPITERLAASDLFFQAKTGMKSQWDRIRVFTTPKGKRTPKIGVKRKADDFPRLLEKIKAQREKPALIIIDTLRANIDGDDSKQEDVNPFLENARILSSTFDCCVLFVHHQGKRGSDSMLMGNDRGSSIIQDALEGAYRLDGSIKNPPVALVSDKIRDFEEPDPIVFHPEKYIFKSEGGVTHNSIVLVDADEEQRAAYLKSKEKTSKDKRYDQKTKEYLTMLLDALKGIHGEALESMLENSKPMLKVERRSLIKAGISSSHLSNGDSRLQSRLVDEGYVSSMVDGKKGFWVDCGKLLDFMNHQE